MSLDDTLDRLSENYFSSLSNPVNKIYIDMELLQDFKLGALLSTVTVKEEVEYIMSCLPVYNLKFNNRTAEYFPVLKKTDEELLSIVKNNSIKTALLSPWTKIYNNLNVILKYLYLNSQHIDGNPKQITIVVNCSDMKYPIQMFDLWANTMKETHPKLDIRLIAYPRYTAPVELYEEFDMFFIYDHEKFFNTEGIASAISADQKKEFKIVYSPPYINDSLGLDKSEYPKALASSRSLLNLIVDFFYMPNGVYFNKLSMEKITNESK